MMATELRPLDVPTERLSWITQVGEHCLDEARSTAFEALDAG